MEPPSPPPGRRRAGPRARLLVAGASLVVALLVGEITLRAVLDTGSYRVWEPGLETVFRPAPGLMAGIEGESRFRINSKGFRGDEPDPAADFRVLVLGGSSTECLYLDQSEAWPGLVPALLPRGESGPRPQIQNGGVSGRTTRDHVVQVRHLLPQHPEFDALLLMCGVNDLALRLGKGDDYDPSYMARPEVEDLLLPRAFARRPLSVSTGEPWFRRTAWWRFASLLKDRVAGANREQDEAGAIYAEWRAKRTRAGQWVETLPDLTAALAEQTSNLGAIAEMCTARGVRLVLVTHPAVWAAGLAPEVEARLWMGGVGDYQHAEGAYYYTAEALAVGLAAFNHTLQEFAAARNLECIDLAAALGGAPEYFYDDVHLNEAGARRAAEVVAAHFAARPPFR